MRALGLLALLVAGTLGQLVDAAPQPTDRWFGPTGMLEGWHVRIPVAVRNPLDRDLFDATVGWDVQLGEALVEAGWTTSVQGGRARLESFVLDNDSVRVVEYRNLTEGGVLGGQPVGEVPSQAFVGLLDLTRAFDARTQPDVHVAWIVPGAFPAGATRYFYVYLDSRTNGDQPAPSYSEMQRAPLDARHWISRGTTLYGAAQTLTLVGLHWDTTVQVEIYAQGQPVPIVTGEGDEATTGVVRLGRDDIRRIPIAGTAQLVRVRADKPVIALGTPEENPPDSRKGLGQFGGIMPSANGGAAGTTFTLPPYNYGYLVVATQGDANVRTGSGETFTLQAGVPFRAVQTTSWVRDRVDGTHFAHPRLVTLSSDAPVMVLAWPNATGKAQMPSLWGAPTGSRILDLPYAAYFCGAPAGPNGKECQATPLPPCTTERLGFRGGQFIVATLDESAQVWGRDASSGQLRHPTKLNGDLDRTPVALGPWRFHRESVTPPEQGSNPACPVILHTTEGANTTTYASEGHLIAFGGVSSVGIDDPLTTPLGGIQARDFQTFWNVSVAAYHPGTVVTVETFDGARTTRGLGEGDVLHVAASLVSPARIRADKPVALIPEKAGGFFAGLDESLVVEPLGKAQYRGYMVSLEPADGKSEPFLGIAAPGKAATYKLRVTNLARDHLGEPVADTIRLEVDAALGGWLAQLSASELALGPGASELVELAVTPPPDVIEGTPLRLGVRAVSAGNPSMVDQVVTTTTARVSYGVRAWFDREGGPETRALTLDPGERIEVQVAVKNLATVDDVISLQAVAYSPAWGVSAGTGGLTVTDVQLAPGEVRVVPVTLQAPELNASQTLLDILATSRGDSAQTSKVTASARIRTDVRVALLANASTLEADPGTSARFDVRFLNRGEDTVSIRLNVTGAMPDGWSAPVVRLGEHELTELSGILPGVELPLAVSVDVPPDARRGDRANLHLVVELVPQFVGDEAHREELDLVALAAARHDLIVRTPGRAFTADAEGEVVARLTLDNQGNGDETLRLVPTTLPPRAAVLLPSPALALQGEEATLSLRLRVANHTPPGTYEVTSLVATDRGHTLPWHFNVTVLERPRVALHAAGPAEGVVGTRMPWEVEIENAGNTPLALPPRLLLPAGWSVVSAPETGEIAPGERLRARLDLLAPATSDAGVHELRPDPEWAEGPTVAWRLHTVVLSASLDREGDDLLVRVANAGTGDARDVEVSIVTGEDVVDRVRLARVPAGGEASAILAAPSSAAGARVRVAAADDGIAPVEISAGMVLDSREAGASTSVLLVLALLVGSALRRRSR